MKELWESQRTKCHHIAHRGGDGSGHHILEETKTNCMKLKYTNHPEMV
jgi:hypothetical protein